MINDPAFGERVPTADNMNRFAIGRNDQRRAILGGEFVNVFLAHAIANGRVSDEIQIADQYADFRLIRDIHDPAFIGFDLVSGESFVQRRGALSERLATSSGK
jgi:hypothetical protein